MRHFWALMACVVAVVVSVASCSASGNKSTVTGSGGRGGGSPTSGTQMGAGGGGAASTASSSVGSFVGSSTSSSSGDAGPVMCPGYKSCQAQNFNCGMQSDGCGALQDCGTCSANLVCMNGLCISTCTPLTCQDQGFNCGMAGDGCGGTIDCGPTCPTGESCGAGGTANVCGTGVTCVSKTCMDQGFNCGMQGDTCGNIIDCGTCSGNQTCGGGGQTGVCGAPVCTPKTCAGQGFNCGMATDTCGTVINCGTCPTGQSCGLAGPNQCGTGGCTGLCMQQQTCSGGGTTSVSGVVYAPNGTDPLYNALVYVPNGGPAPAWGVQPFPAGVSCSPCGSDVSGDPLVQAVTAVDGTFKITNMPVGTNIPLVIQLGRWRRKITISNVPACTNTALTAQQTRMPQKEAEGDPADNIPLMAFSTGTLDSLECIFRKIGIQDSEFSNPASQGGTGRIRFYVGNPANGGPGAEIDANTPAETVLWGTQAEINQYDMVLFPCQGAQYNRNTNAQAVVMAYANAGGRVFTTHYSYVWLFQNSPWSSTATWTTGINEKAICTDPNTGYINMSFPKGKALAQWLQIVGASTTLGQIQINTLRGDTSAVNAPAQLWMTINNTGAGCAGKTLPMHYDFTTPLGATAANTCGRVVYDDYHVEDNVVSYPGTYFPAECTAGAMTPQEKLLEFMLFDLASCVTPGGSTCTPKTCGGAGASCGPIGDGCGNILQCGSCPSGMSCIAGQCSNGCTPKTCQQQGFQCGMQSDGCGNAIDCGSCPAGTCGANGQIGKCGSGSCTPKSCSTLGVMCGATGDGCGNIQQCGTCPSGEVCMSGMCQKPSCTPNTCQGLGYNCGMAGDGCGGTIDCGTCQAPQSCGGGGKSNVCGGGSGA